MVLRGLSMKRNASLRKLALKWIRKLFRCLKSRTDYDQQRYIDSWLRKCPDIKNFLPQSQQIT